MKCQICHDALAEWTWQPFGPDTNLTTAFTLPGSHYRGFPLLKVCEDCRAKIKAEPVIFTYRHEGYVTDPVGNLIHQAPF